MQLGPITPILRSFDEAKAKQFYIDFLGFTVDWEHRFEAGFPLYMQLSHSNCVLHVSEHHGDCTPGTAVRIHTVDLQLFHAQLVDKAYSFAKPQIVQPPWGGQEMSVVDPFGNRLIFVDVEHA